MREKLIELIDGYDYPSSNDGLADHLITNGVTIPVRCKDCKHCKEYRNRLDPMYNHLICRRRDNYTEGVDEDGFCSYGERSIE